MSPEEVAGFLDEQRVVTCATLGRDGWPHLMPLWYVLREGEVWAWTYAKSQKVVNVRRDPRATVLVATGEKYEELKGVSITGTATVVDDLDEVLAFGERVYAKYWGPIDNDLVREGVRTKPHSLAGCVECHASTKTGSVLGEQGFCESCHRYASVKLDCFECHASKPERVSARAKP